MQQQIVFSTNTDFLSNLCDILKGHNLSVHLIEIIVNCIQDSHFKDFYDFYRFSTHVSL